MKFRLFCLTGLAAAGLFFTAAAQTDLDKVSGDEFMRTVRKAPAGESWAKLEGKAIHKRSGARQIEAPVRLAVRFTPSRVIAQLIFNKDEIYHLSQTFLEPPVFSGENMLPQDKPPQLPLYGISVSDLTLSFLYREVVREDSRESVKMQKCRVFVLKGASEKEFVRVFLSTDYAFPVKAEWYNALPDGKIKPVRELEVGSVKKENGFWIVTELKLFGENWRTRVDFDKRDAGYSGQSVPSDLFVKP